MVSRVAIIPARGGSKRIPRKNIVDFCGKPLIAYTIEAALRSEMFDDVFVSTDDQEIASVSLEYGAKVPFLRESKADDHSNVSDAVVFTLNELKHLGLEYDYVYQLMPVCPLRDSNDIINFIQHMEQRKLNFLISAFSYVWMNPWWAYKLENNKPIPIFNKINIRSQDLPSLYCPTGAIWGANIEKLMDQGTFYGKGFEFFLLNWKNAVDIDEYADLELTEMIKRYSEEELPKH